MEKENIVLEKYNTKSWFISALLGLFIGLAIIVPGISGATIAIIFALYNKLIYALGNIFKDFKRCFMFLLPIIIGGIIGLILGFFAVQKLFELMPFTIICLFAGLMIGAFPAVCDEIKGIKATSAKLTLLIIGVLIPILIGVFSIILSGSESGGNLNLSWSVTLLYIPLGIVIAITQIVPGLSASALLMTIGQFGPLLDSFHLSFIKENPLVLVLYCALIVGFVIGIVLFSKVLNYLLNNKKGHTFYTIVGLSAGSVLSMFINPDIYSVYISWQNGGQGMAYDLACGIILFAIGIIGAYALVRFERKKKANKEEE